MLKVRYSMTNAITYSNGIIWATWLYILIIEYSCWYEREKQNTPRRIMRVRTDRCCDGDRIMRGFGPSRSIVWWPPRRIAYPQSSRQTCLVIHVPVLELSCNSRACSWMEFVSSTVVAKYRISNLKLGYTPPAHERRAPPTITALLIRHVHLRGWLQLCGL